MIFRTTVIIPLYNAANFLDQSVRSCLQFPEVREILIIDDGSCDESLAMAMKLTEEFKVIKVLQHPDKKNHGVSATRNLGIDKATQEFITLLDADDYWLPNRFDAEREIFKNPKIDGVFGAIGTEFLSEEGKKQYLEKFDNTIATVGYAAEGKEVFWGLTEMKKGFAASFSMIALTVRKCALENPTLRLNESLKIGEDKEFIIKLSFLKTLKSGIITEPIAMRTAHESNTITKIKPYSYTFFKNDELLYHSLFKWASKQKKMPKDVIETFKYKYLSYKIATEKGFGKYLSFIAYTVFHPKLLKTRYRYFALKKAVD